MPLPGHSFIIVLCPRIYAYQIFSSSFSHIHLYVTNIFANVFETISSCISNDGEGEFYSLNPDLPLLPPTSASILLSLCWCYAFHSHVNRIFTPLFLQVHERSVVTPVACACPYLECMHYHHFQEVEGATLPSFFPQQVTVVVVGSIVQADSVSIRTGDESHEQFTPKQRQSVPVPVRVAFRFRGGHSVSSQLATVVYRRAFTRLSLPRFPCFEVYEIFNVSRGVEIFTEQSIRSESIINN